MKLQGLHKSLNGVPLVIKESAVKEFLIGARYIEQAVRKSKRLFFGSASLSISFDLILAIDQFLVY